jgi:tetratricopeptide (TPR) repeat protein
MLNGRRLWLIPLLGFLALDFAAAAYGSAWQDYAARAFEAFRSGNYPKSISLYEHALQNAGAISVSCEETQQVRDNLGVLYSALQRYAEAERIVLDGMDGKCKGSRLSESKSVAQSLALGEVYRVEQKYEPAQRAFQSALETAELLRAEKHPGVALVLTNLGQLYLDQRRILAAEPILQRAKDILLQSSDLDQHLASALNQLAECYLLEKEYARAQPLLVRSISIYEKELGPAHPYLAAPLSNLGFVYNSDGRFELAESVLTRALSIAQNSLGAGHPQVAQILDILAASFWGQKNAEKAELCLRSAVSVAESSHVLTFDRIRYSHDLADLDRIQHRYDEAEQLYRDCLHRLSSYQYNIELRKDIVQDLAALLRITKRSSEARQLESMHFR